MNREAGRPRGAGVHDVRRPHRAVDERLLAEGRLAPARAVGDLALERRTGRAARAPGIPTGSSSGSSRPRTSDDLGERISSSGPVVLGRVDEQSTPRRRASRLPGTAQQRVDLGRHQPRIEPRRLGGARKDHRHPIVHGARRRAFAVVVMMCRSRATASASGRASSPEPAKANGSPPATCSGRAASSRRDRCATRRSGLRRSAPGDARAGSCRRASSRTVSARSIGSSRRRPSCPSPSVGSARSAARAARAGARAGRTMPSRAASAPFVVSAVRGLRAS